MIGDTRFIWFFISLFLSVALTYGVKQLASHLGIVDKPGEHPKNIHRKPIPLLGGWAIYGAVFLCVLFLLFTSSVLTSGEITTRHYAGFLLGGLVLMIGGYLDDRYDLPPRAAILAPLFASFLVILFGVDIEKLTNPLGGVLFLANWQSDALVFVWLMVVMYALKFADGLDGLDTGISAIGTCMILLLASSAAYFQPDVQVLSAICLGALIGFLFWNRHPAKIFLGEGGSLFVAYIVGVLAVISGGKLATAMLVLGLPLFDLCWVILRRFREGGLSAILKADRKHLHHRLFDRGWSQRRIVFFYYAIATLFGITALFLQSRLKLLILGVFVFCMFLSTFLLTGKKNHHKIL